MSKKHQRRWIYPQIDPSTTAMLIEEFKIHPILAKILTARGFRESREVHDYLYSQLPDLHSPHLLIDMEKAVERILKAMERGETILIYGDNDVDGITSTTLLVDFFRKLRVPVLSFISLRHQITRHLLEDGLDFALQKGCSLVITVDCGITAFEEILHFSERKIDLIVTDHHLPMDKIPDCFAILNPKRMADPYPNKDLAGVGVAFKLAHALTDRLISAGRIDSSDIDLKEFLDLVALGTIADMGSLLGENRILVRYGLKQLTATKRIGLKELFGICGLNPSNEISTNDIVLKIAPRINSLGRIADPNRGVELLLTEDREVAEKLAAELDLHNRARQEVEKEMIEDLDALLKREPFHLTHRAIVLSSKNWHSGIVPLLSARLVRKHNRPCTIIAIEGNLAKGSIRSIKELPVLEGLQEMSSLFVNFGGHNYAAGLTIEPKNIESFRKKFQQFANSRLTDQHISPKILLDAPLSFRELDFDLMESLELLEPFGQDNPAPVFYTQARQSWHPRPFKKNHMKFFLSQENIVLEAMGFHMVEEASGLSELDRDLQVAFTPQIFRGIQSSRIQLILRSLGNS